MILVNQGALSMQAKNSDKRRQLDLFRPQIDVGLKLKAALRESVRKCSLSREQIVDEMAHLARRAGMDIGRGKTISLPNLDAWLAAGKVNQIPSVMLPLFCHVVSDLGPLKVLVGPLDADVIGKRKAKLLSWAEMEIQSRGLNRRKNKVLQEVKNAGAEENE